MNDSQRILELEREIERLRTQESGGVWAAWTPTLTNLTIGSGTLVSTYLRMGGLAHVRIVFTLGAGSAVGTGPIFTLPVAATTRGIWQAQYNDTGTAYYIGRAEAIAGSLYLYRSLISGSDLRVAAISASIPFTWAAGDIIIVDGVYGI